MDLLRRRPGLILLLILVLHGLIWTLLPVWSSPNLQLDLAENLTYGKEWQLSYWKHPPLPWWIGEAAYRATGHIAVVYGLGPLSVAICFLAVWLLARDVLRATQPEAATSEAAAAPAALTAVLAVLVLEGTHYYNFSAVKFGHDQIQLPLWSLAALFFYRALTRQRRREWILAGLFLALCFWGKYLAVVLAASFGLFLLLEPQARRSLGTAGPYLMAATFLIVLAPNLYALAATDFLPLHYADERARIAANWLQFIKFPLQWIGGQLLYLAPTLLLMALLYYKAPRAAPPPPRDGGAVFARRFVAMLALGPFLIATLAALVMGRLAVALWGYPMWTFLPLAILVWRPPALDAASLRRFAKGWLIVFLAVPVIYAAVQWGEPLLRDRPKATDFPGQAFAGLMRKAWQERTGAPLVYATGTEFAVNNVAVYAPERPHVIPHGDPRLAPWIDMADVRRRGLLIVWEDGHGRADLDRWSKTFPGMEMGPPVTLPRQTLRPIRPAQLRYAIVPPQP